MSTDYLELKWSVSRGRDTYGYNIVTLRPDGYKAKPYRAMGGGYDMTGTVFGEWLQENYQDRLQAIAADAHTHWTATKEGPWDRTTNKDGHYGMNLYTHSGKVRLDGACGLSSMERIANAIGLEIQHTLNRKGNVTGFIVTDTPLARHC